MTSKVTEVTIWRSLRNFVKTLYVIAIHFRKLKITSNSRISRLTNDFAKIASLL